MKTKITLLLFSIITCLSVRSQDNVLTFSALGKYKIVNITWTVTSNIDVKSFEIQRSVDDTTFITIRTINNGRISLNYEYTDQPAVNKTISYRLKSTSISGKVEYSKIIPVNLIGTSSLSIYPNPVSGSALDVESNDKLLINIFNSTGLNISRKQLLPGHNNVDVNRLTSGMYFMQNTMTGEMLKFIVSK